MFLDCSVAWKTMPEKLGKLGSSTTYTLEKWRKIVPMKLDKLASIELEHQESSVNAACASILKECWRNSR